MDKFRRAALIYDIISTFNRVQLTQDYSELEALDLEQLDLFESTFTESTKQETRDGIAELKERRRVYEQATKPAPTAGN